MTRLRFVLVELPNEISIQRELLGFILNTGLRLKFGWWILIIQKNDVAITATIIWKIKLDR